MKSLSNSQLGIFVLMLWHQISWINKWALLNIHVYPREFNFNTVHKINFNNLIYMMDFSHRTRSAIHCLHGISASSQPLATEVYRVNVLWSLSTLYISFVNSQYFVVNLMIAVLFMVSFNAMSLWNNECCVIHGDCQRIAIILYVVYVVGPLLCILFQCRKFRYEIRDSCVLWN